MWGFLKLDFDTLLFYPFVIVTSIWVCTIWWHVQASRIWRAILQFIHTFALLLLLLLQTFLCILIIMSGFYWAFATGVASQQGTLTLPDTWFRPPFWDLLMLQLLTPNSSNLPCLYSTFHLEYPLVLTRFCYEVRHPLDFKWQYLPLANAFTFFL